MSPVTNAKVTNQDVIYREVLNHARHYSAIRVSLGVFFWSAAGAIAARKSDFGPYWLWICLFALCLGVYWVAFFGEMNATCWKYAQFLEGDYPPQDQDGKSKKLAKEWNDKWSDAGFHKVFPGTVSLWSLQFRDAPAWAHLVVSGFITVLFVLMYLREKGLIVL